MSFHLGKPILIMLLAALAAGGVAMMRRAHAPADLLLWTFADPHRQSYQSTADAFEQRTGLKVELDLVAYRALNLRLQSMFNGGIEADDAPDVAEIEIGSVGRYFRPPVDQVGFLPLNDILRDSGWMDRVVATRFAPWSKQGVIFGVPHDVHPVTLTYRDDLFQQAGIDLATVKTWPELHDRCVEFKRYWRSKNYLNRHAIELPAASSDYLVVMLLQRGINLIDDYGNVHMADPKVANTLAFYAQLVAGERAVAGESGGGKGSFQMDVDAGNLCAFITPDWRVSDLKDYGRALSGKMRMIPLPVFDATDAPTSTWGGTMIGITRSCKRPQDAWRLIEQLYFGEQALRDRRKFTDIVPPVKSMWNDPTYHQPDPYFGNAKYEGKYMGFELYIELADKIPPRYVTPATAVAQTQLTYVLNLATQYVERQGPAGLEAACQQWLNEAAADLQRRMDHWKFD